MYWSYLNKFLEGQQVLSRISPRVLAIYQFAQQRKRGIQVVVGVSHLHPQKVDPREFHILCVRTKQKVHEGIHDGVVHVVATAIHVDIHVGAAPEHILFREHFSENSAREVAPRRHIGHRPEEIQRHSSQHHGSNSKRGTQRRKQN